MFINDSEHHKSLITKIKLNASYILLHDFDKYADLATVGYCATGTP